MLRKVGSVVLRLGAAYFGLCLIVMGGVAMLLEYDGEGAPASLGDRLTTYIVGTLCILAGVALIVRAFLRRKNAG